MTSRGFTLVELVLVMVLVGILAAYAAPRFNRTDFDDAASAGELVEAVRYAQSMTMAQGGVVRYRVRISASGYAVESAASPFSNEHFSVVPDPFSGGTYARSSLTLSPIGNVSFDGRGRPTCSWSTSCGAITIGGSKVQIEPVTGYVR